MKLFRLMSSAVFAIAVMAAVSYAAGKWEHPQEKKYTMYISLKGTLDSVDETNHKITLKTESGSVREFPLDYDVYVLKEGERGQLSDLKPGSEVLVRYLRQGLTVTSIEHS